MRQVFKQQIITIERMFQLSKRRRLEILEQISDKRERMPSAERRKVVEGEYNNFLKTMNQPRVANNSSNFNFSSAASRISEQKSSNVQDSIPLMYSPTIGEIPRPSTDRQQLSNDFYQNQKKETSPQRAKSPEKVNNVNFYKPTSPKVNKPSPQHDLNALNEEKSELHSEAKVEDQEIHMPNPSKSQTSANNSEAIFFTSEFKQYIDRQSPPKEEAKPEEIKEEKGENQQKVDNNVSKASEKAENTLNKNKSGESLVLSNDSSIRFSLNQSAAYKAVTKKLTHELVVDSLGDSVYMMPIQNLALSLVIFENWRDFIEFSKQVKLQKNCDRIKKKMFLQQLQVQFEINLELRKNKIKCAQFKGQKQQWLIRQCFYRWRSQFESKTSAVDNFIAKRQAETLNKSFRTLKMLLFDKKINNQVDMYYLSKIFFAFKRVAQKQSKISRQKAYRFYFKHLKKRIFNRMIQCVYTSQHENELNQVAKSSFNFNLLRKAFDSWRQFMPAEERYVRLAMTTHIELKETQDKRLFQTRTFDFRELH